MWSIFTSTTFTSIFTSTSFLTILLLVSLAALSYHYIVKAGIPSRMRKVEALTNICAGPLPPIQQVAPAETPLVHGQQKLWGDQ